MALVKHYCIEWFSYTAEFQATWKHNSYEVIIFRKGIDKMKSLFSICTKASVLCMLYKLRNLEFQFTLLCKDVDILHLLYHCGEQQLDITNITMISADNLRICQDLMQILMKYSSEKQFNSNENFVVLNFTSSVYCICVFTILAICVLDTV